MDIRNTAINAKSVIQSLIEVLGNEGIDAHSIKFKIGNAEEGYESEDLDFGKLIDLALKELEEVEVQAVLETQQALNDRLLVKSIREHIESHIDETSVNDLFDKGWLAAMKCIQNNIDMLEAQGQKG